MSKPKEIDKFYYVEHVATHGIIKIRKGQKFGENIVTKIFIHERVGYEDAVVHLQNNGKVSIESYMIGQVAFLKEVDAKSYCIRSLTTLVKNKFADLVPYIHALTSLSRSDNILSALRDDRTGITILRKPKEIKKDEDNEKNKKAVEVQAETKSDEKGAEKKEQTGKTDKAKPVNETPKRKGRPPKKKAS